MSKGKHRKPAFYGWLWVDIILSIWLAAIIAIVITSWNGAQ